MSQAKLPSGPARASTAQRPIIRPASSDPRVDEELLRDESGWLSSDDENEINSDDGDDDGDKETAIWKKLPLPSNPQHLPRLELPIIIPQRRPGTRLRGFARVYPPILESKGIPPTEFLSFLKDYHKEMSISPAITVLNLAIFATGFIPSWEAQVASAIAQTLVQTAAGVYSYFKADAFVKRANEQLFRPRGMLMAVANFNPREGSELKFGKVDLAPFFDTIAPRLRNRVAEAETVVLPESAPLLHPSKGEAPAGFAKRAMKSFDAWRDQSASDDFKKYYPNANIAPSSLVEIPSAPTTMDRFKEGASIATTALFSPVSSIGAIIQGKDIRETKVAQSKRKFRKRLTDFKKKRRLAANTLYLLIVQDTTQDAPTDTTQDVSPPPMQDPPPYRMPEPTFTAQDPPS